MDLLKALAAAITWGLDLDQPATALSQARRYLSQLDYELTRHREGRCAAKPSAIARNRASLLDAIRWLEKSA